MKIGKATILTPVAAAAATLALVLSSAGIASAATASLAQRTVIAQAASSSAVVPEATWSKTYGYYLDPFLCDNAGEGKIGAFWDGGIVVGYKCEFNGEPGPLGPWVLVLIIVSASSPPVAKDPGTAASPNATCG